MQETSNFSSTWLTIPNRKKAEALKKAKKILPKKPRNRNTVRSPVAAGMTVQNSKFNPCLWRSSTSSHKMPTFLLTRLNILPCRFSWGMGSGLELDTACTAQKVTKCTRRKHSSGKGHAMTEHTGHFLALWKQWDKARSMLCIFIVLFLRCLTKW